MKLNYRHYERYTKVLLHFDDDNEPFKDECGNTWTAYGSPTIGTTNAKFGKALTTSGNSYLKLDGSITIGGKNFTIDCWNYVSSGNYPAPFSLFAYDNNDTTEAINLFTYHSDKDTGRICINKTWVSLKADYRNALHHFALVYQHSLNLVTIYVDGVKDASLSITVNRIARYLKVANTNNNTAGCFTGTVDEFRITDGIARWTENFTPPTSPCILSEDKFLVVDSCKLYSIPPNKPRVVLDLANNQKLYSAVVPATLNKCADENIVALLHFDESTTKDELDNTWQVNGSPTLTTETVKFGSSALDLNGGSIQLNNLNLSGEATIEGWIYMPAISDVTFFSAPNDKFSIQSLYSALGVKYNNAGGVFSVAYPINEWFHLAKSANSIFLDGVKSYDDAYQILQTPVTSLVIGTGNFIIDELRITNETLYTADFTPPTAPLNLQYEQIDNPIASKIKFPHNDQTVAIASKKYFA